MARLSSVPKFRAFLLAADGWAIRSPMKRRWPRPLRQWPLLGQQLLTSNPAVPGRTVTLKASMLAARRTAQWRDLLHATRSSDLHRELASPLQRRSATCIAWLQAWLQAGGTRSLCAGILRVAGCAMPTGSAGHAGETTNSKLTFHPGHSMKADQVAVTCFTGAQ